MYSKLNCIIVSRISNIAMNLVAEWNGLPNLKQTKWRKQVFFCPENSPGIEFFFYIFTALVGFRKNSFFVFAHGYLETQKSKKVSIDDPWILPRPTPKRYQKATTSNYWFLHEFSLQIPQKWFRPLCMFFHFKSLKKYLHTQSFLKNKLVVWLDAGEFNPKKSTFVD